MPRAESVTSLIDRILKYVAQSVCARSSAMKKSIGTSLLTATFCVSFSLSFSIFTTIQFCYSLPYLSHKKIRNLLEISTAKDTMFLLLSSELFPELFPTYS